MIESGVKCSDRVHDLLGLLRVGHQATTTTIWGTGHQSLLYLNFPTRVAGVADIMNKARKSKDKQQSITGNILKFNIPSFKKTPRIGKLI